MFGPNHDSFIIGDLSGGDPVIQRPLGMIFLGASRVGGGPEADILPYLQPCTATDAEVEARVNGGEFSFDVIDEHSTTLWFCNRNGWREAWRLARAITKGRKVEGLRSGSLHCWPDFALYLSAHHVAVVPEVL